MEKPRKTSVSCCDPAAWNMASCDNTVIDAAVGDIMNRIGFQGLSEAEESSTLWGKVTNLQSLGGL